MALLLSVIAFTTIVIILSAYDNQPQFDLSRGININTIIAILSTIVKATLIFVVAEVVGQFKWVWVESPQRLRDVEYFTKLAEGHGGLSNSCSNCGNLRLLLWERWLSLPLSLSPISLNKLQPHIRARSTSKEPRQLTSPNGLEQELTVKCRS
ncbi:hypothetical protein CGCVW01_v010109 [Colletotrichum viniferum]|nr:hypothetical protein CGCVW01_v010109 [Colletotrichum viniferum]